MHAAGTLLGLCTLVVPFVVGHPLYALLWPVVAYSFAWTGHFLIEGNKPATFGHPVWSFLSDFKMLALMLTGRLESRMRKPPGASPDDPHAYVTAPKKPGPPNRSASAVADLPEE